MLEEQGKYYSEIIKRHLQKKGTENMLRECKRRCWFYKRQ